MYFQPKSAKAARYAVRIHETRARSGEVPQLRSDSEAEVSAPSLTQRAHVLLHERAVDGLPCSLLTGRDQVGAGGWGEAGVAMPEVSRQRLGTLARIQQHGGVEVPQRVHGVGLGGLDAAILAPVSSKWATGAPSTSASSCAARSTGGQPQCGPIRTGMIRKTFRRHGRPVRSAWPGGSRLRPSRTSRRRPPWRCAWSAGPAAGRSQRCRLVQGWR